MGIFDFLFGKKDIKNKIEIDGSITSIKDINFIGEHKISLNNEWLVSWADYDSENSVFGHRKKGHNKVILINNNDKNVVLQLQLERPNSCNISNNGTFSIEEWHFGEGTKGTFYVYSKNGEKILEKIYKSNIISSGLSSDGKYAICQTGISSNIDSALLTFFDLLNNSVIFSINSSIDFANSYEIDTFNKKIKANINEISIYYDFEGNILNLLEYYEKKLDSDRYTEVISISELLLKQNQKELFEKIYSSLERVKLDKYINDTNKSKILKLQGMILEYKENNKEALLFYKEALLLNSKIGLKKKIDNLQIKIKII